MNFSPPTREDLLTQLWLTEVSLGLGRAAAAHLEGHELVVGLGRPGVDLHRVLQSQDQEFNPLVFHWRTKVEREALRNFLSEMIHQLTLVVTRPGLGNYVVYGSTELRRFLTSKFCWTFRQLFLHV